MKRLQSKPLAINTAQLTQASPEEELIRFHLDIAPEDQVVLPFQDGRAGRQTRHFITEQIHFTLANIVSTTLKTFGGLVTVANAEIHGRAVIVDDGKMIRDDQGNPIIDEEVGEEGTRLASTLQFNIQSGRRRVAGEPQLAVIPKLGFVLQTVTVAGKPDQTRTDADRETAGAVERMVKNVLKLAVSIDKEAHPEFAELQETASDFYHKIPVNLGNATNTGNETDLKKLGGPGVKVANDEIEAAVNAASLMAAAMQGNDEDATVTDTE